MASITTPGRESVRSYGMIRAESVKMADGTHVGFSLSFAEYGTGKLVTIELDYAEADRLVNWQNYVKAKGGVR